MARGRFRIQSGGSARSFSPISDALQGVSASVGFARLGGSKNEFTSPLKQNTFLMAAWNSISRNLTGIPIRVYEGDFGKSTASMPVVNGHPLQDMIDKPFFSMVQPTFWHRVIGYWLDWGDAPILVYGRNGLRSSMTEVPTSLYPADPRRLRPQFSRGSPLPTHWTATLFGQTFRVEPHQLVRPFLSDPDQDGFQSMSPLISAWTDLRGDFLAGRYQEDFFDNGATVSGVLKSTKRLTQQRADELRNLFEDQHVGPGKSHRIKVLGEDADYNPLGSTQRDMEFPELRNWGVRVVSAITGVPLKELGATEGMNHATALSMDGQYWTRVLIPLITLFQAHLWCELFRFIEGGRYWVGWDTSNVAGLRGDELQKVEIAGRLQQLGVRWSDINLHTGLNLPPQGELDDAQFSQANLISLVDALAPTPEPTAPIVMAVPEPAVEEEVEEDQEPESARTVMMRAIHKRAARVRRGRRLRAAFDAQVRGPSRKVYRSKLNRFLLEMRKGLRERFRAIEQAKTGRAPIRYAITEQDIEAIIGDRVIWDGALSRLTRGAGEGLLARLEAFIRQETGRADFVIDVADPKWTEFLTFRGAELVRIVNDNTIREIRDTLLEGIRSGDTPAALADRVFGMGSLSTSRANDIAFTESGIVASSARNDALQEAGIERHVWINSGKQTSRTSHQAVNGEVRPIGEAFSNGLLHPHGPLADGGAAPADEVVGCECMAVAEVA